MEYMTPLSGTPYPQTIRRLRMAVLVISILFALWNTSFMRGAIPISPVILLLSPLASWGIFWQPITAALTIPYGGLGIEMVFDLILLNFFLVPISSFVFAYLEHKRFIRFLSSLIAIGTAVFWGVNTCVTYASPCSLFSSLALSIIVFWFLLHRDGGSTIVIAIPISRWWILFIACLIIFPAPIFSHEWGKVLMAFSMALSSYLWGITSCRLRSHISQLASFERWLDTTYHSLIRLFQWYIARPVRQLFLRKR